MAMIISLLTLSSSLLVAAAPTLEKRQISNYRPLWRQCPNTPLVRSADGLSDAENEYRSFRKPQADEALSAWLQNLDSSFPVDNLPAIGVAASGGGYRSMLSTAGAIQAFDSRDSDSGVAGLFQSTSYQSGTSGGAWFLGSVAGSDWETVSELQSNLWEPAFERSLLLPANLLSAEGLLQTPLIVNQVLSKAAAGVDIGLVDIWGRLLSYQFIDGFTGGSGLTLSGLTEKSNFQNHNVPYPLMLATSIDVDDGECAVPDSPVYEFGPHEYGSWDAGVSAFALTEYMGSPISAGEPANTSCLTEFDNLGFVYGTSSNIFAAVCDVINPSNSSSDPLANILERILLDNIDRDNPLLQDIYAIYPNPFRGLSSSPAVANDPDLFLGDIGALSDRNVPIWPFIQTAAQRVDVVIALDNSGDTDANFPDGTSLYADYMRAQQESLAAMPFVPTPEVFVEQGLNRRATFFGCDDPETVMIIYLPNREYSYPSGFSTGKILYSREETRGMIQNGNEIATQGGEEGWPLCLACGLMVREEGLPEGCEACFEKHCYRK